MKKSIPHKLLIITIFIITGLAAVNLITSIQLVHFFKSKSSSIEIHSWSASAWIQCLQSAADNQLDGMIRSKINNLSPETPEADINC